MAYAAHGADVALGEADGLALPGAQQQFFPVVAHFNPDQLVALVEHDGDEARLAQVLEFGKGGLFDQARALPLPSP